MPSDIHTGERVQEMKRGKADTEVAWLAGGGLATVTVLWPRQAENRAAGDLLGEHAQGELRA